MQQANEDAVPARDDLIESQGFLTFDVEIVSMLAVGANKLDRRRNGGNVPFRICCREA